MQIFGRKAKSLKSLLSEYASELRDCIQWFETFFLTYSNGICGNELEDIAKEVRNAESRCDTKRREIQKELAAGAFMPDFRSDIFKLIEAVDRVPNQAEDIVIYVSIACTPIPDILSNSFKEVIHRNVKCAKDLAEALDLLLIDLNSCLKIAKNTEVEETEIDSLERDLYRGIFHRPDNEATPGQKILLKEFVQGVCAISNRVEDASDLIELIAITRRA